MSNQPDPALVFQWLLQCRGGQQSSCELLADAVLVRIRFYISHKLCMRPKVHADDVVSETLKTFWEKRDAINEDPYLYALKIARYKLFEYFGQIGREQLNESLDPADEEFSKPLPDPAQNIETWLLHKERIRKILEVIRHLEPFCQRVVKGIIAGYSLAEIFENENARDPKLTRTNFDVKKKRCIEGLQQSIPYM
jgi:DNA-directed RNA polymerase specialized sigma24 family protein